MPATIIDHHLILAYRQTEYRVDAPLAFVLTIDRASSALVNLHKQFGVTSSVFITACNPYSKILDDDTNAQRLNNLADELSSCGLTYFSGVGAHPGKQWPGEPSFLVLGLALEPAKILGNRYQQNAIVWCGALAVPQLVLLR